MADITTERPAAVALKALRERSGLSTRALADLLGMKHTTYVDYERVYKKALLPVPMTLKIEGVLVGLGSPPITSAEVRSLGGLPPHPSDLQAALEPNATFHPEQVGMIARRAGPMDVPVYGRAQGGEDGFYDINLTDGPLEYVERPASLSGVRHVFAILVHGTSMDPVWQPDDIVYVVPSRSVSPGDYVVVTLERGPGHQPAALLKRYVSRNDDYVVLEQHNPPTVMDLPRHQVREMWRALHWRDLR